MSTNAQYNPDTNWDAQLLAHGASKTVYALTTPEVEQAKKDLFADPGYLPMFHEAWTKKQDNFHEEFFRTWLAWAMPVVELEGAFPYQYPTAGASEALRQLIYDMEPMSRVHVFEGEYEGFIAYAEAAGLQVVRHTRREPSFVSTSLRRDDKFFISQPSAIDGNVWSGFQEFIDNMPDNSVVVDLTYVGAVPSITVEKPFRLNRPSVDAVVFSLSKPFGVYYDRIGGVLTRKESPALFGNKWFKNLTSLALGTRLLESTTVFTIPEKYLGVRNVCVQRTVRDLNLPGPWKLSDVFLLAYTDLSGRRPEGLMEYLKRGDSARLCLTPLMAGLIHSIELSGNPEGKFNDEE
jgi:hypothetical protein